MFDEAHEAFRNELASVHKDGRRKWVYAREPHGRFHRARVLVAIGLLLFLVAAPFVRFKGEPLILINLLERKFVLFGLVFWPQDFYMVVLLALTVLVTLMVSTAAFGRIWCGWLCPQTIFLEMVFRKIEFAIEGSAAQQLRSDRGPRTPARTARKLLKHAVFFGLSFGIANLFLSYIIGTDQLYTIVTDPPAQHIVGLVAITIFSLLFYGVFARFREQACTLACPYGRVMSALIDRHTVTVTYDRRRGEPRGKLAQAAATPRGDCVDCGQCITVCPTGIDIRNGIQLECVNCTACIDACDDVMTRVSKPKGLIRLTSEEAVRTGEVRWLTPRVKAYAVVWSLLVTGVMTLIALRAPVDVLILRQSGTSYSRLDDGAFANFYNVQVINRSAGEHTLAYRAVEPSGATVSTLGPIDRVSAHRVLESRLMLRIPQDQIKGTATPVVFEVLADGKVIERVQSSFLGPGVE